jgi:hypothetical protein
MNATASGQPPRQGCHGTDRRPTAFQIFGAVVNLIREDPEISFAKRRSWVHAYCEATDEQVPAPYDDETVTRYAREAEETRQLKRRRIVNVEKDESESGSEGSRDSVSDDDQRSVRHKPSTASELSESFGKTRLLPVCNAETVWGDAAGFTVVPHEQILDMHKQKALDVASAGINTARAATVAWPKLTSWDQAAWLSFDKAWWTCTNEAVNHGVPR